MPQAKEDAALLKRNLYKLTFDKDNAHTPLIASIVKAHPVDISILYGSIERLAGHPFGRLIADITGEPEDIQNALASFEKEGVKVEVIPYA
jgi:D-methionine transport system ATP-binding protein